jgi:hypothetical protein
MRVVMSRRTQGDENMSLPIQHRIRSIVGVDGAMIVDLDQCTMVNADVVGTEIWRPEHGIAINDIVEDPRVGFAAPREGLAADVHDYFRFLGSQSLMDRPYEGQDEVRVSRL